MPFILLIIGMLVIATPMHIGKDKHAIHPTDD
jgi:hypothetical protein